MSFMCDKIGFFDKIAFHDYSRLSITETGDYLLVWFETVIVHPIEIRYSCVEGRTFCDGPRSFVLIWRINICSNGKP